MARKDFVEQLQSLGYTVEDLGKNQLAIQYCVPIGRLMGQMVRVGFAVGDDFPLNPPSGLHVTPQLLPINKKPDPHPNGGVHESPFGPEWQYWSRPFKEWGKTDHSVRTYLAHIRHLFETI
jgi:hypothetical protein